MLYSKEMNEMKNRLLYMDVTRALAMFLVVLGHIIVNYDTRTYSAPFAQVIYSFHTALFMFVSGWFFQNVLRKEFKTTMWDKFRQLILPYLSWSIISLIIIDIPASGFNIESCLLDFIKGGFLQNYWYIKILYLYIIVTFWTIKLCHNKWIGCVISFLLFTLLPNFSFSQIFIPFFLAGYLGRDFVEKHNGWNCILILTVLLFGLYCLWDGSYNYTTLNMNIVPYLIRTSIGVLSSYLIIILLKQLLNVFKSETGVLNFISYAGTITLGVYLSHGLFYMGMIQKLLIQLIPSDMFFVYLLFSLVVFILSTVLVYLIQKNKYLSFALLGTKIERIPYN